MEKLICTSCKRDVSNDRGAVIFKCPSCGKGVIVRCSNCRRKGVAYRCPVCGFEGP